MALVVMVTFESVDSPVPWTLSQEVLS